MTDTTTPLPPVVDRDTWTAQVNELRVRETAHTRDAPSLVSESMGSVVKALVAVAAELTAQIAGLEAELADRFDEHRAAKVIRSLPGLGTILGEAFRGGGPKPSDDQSAAMLSASVAEYDVSDARPIFEKGAA